MAEDKEKMRPTMVYGAWFFESKGIPYIKEKGVPAEGWKLVELIPGKYKSIDEIRSKIDAVLELNPNCDVLVLGQGTEMLVIDLYEYKHKYWPKIEELFE